MNIKHPTNKNLTIHQGSSFKGIELIPNMQFLSEYLSSIEAVMSRAVSEHHRTFLLRFDLRFPKLAESNDNPVQYKDGVISRFFASLEAKFRADIAKKKKSTSRVHDSTMRFIWCREQSMSNQPHYHVALFLNWDTYRTIGSYGNHHGNNKARIYQAWASALGYEEHDVGGLIHFPKDRPFYLLDVNSTSYSRVYGDAMKRLSYLAKSKTKHYKSNGRSFGCSRK
jgi:hypothetical protein